MVLGESNWGRDLSPAWREIQTVPEGAGAAIRKQGHLDWKQWGRQQSFPIQLTFAGESVAVARSEQLVQAAFHHPIGWLVGLQASVFFGDPANPDTVIIGAETIAGLGSGRFPGDWLVGTIGPGTPFNLVKTLDPMPAETMIATLGFGIVAAAAGTFPRLTTVTVGAFVAPQVWP